MNLKETQVKGAWLQEWGTVVAHEGAVDVYKLTIQAPEIARRATAGQFVEVKCAPGRGYSADPLLRRPFSICEIMPETGTITVIYRVVGHGTRTLAEFPIGGEIDVLGPLGTSFPWPGAGRGRLGLVGGGLGIPPMAAAAEWARIAGRDAVAILGARTQRYLAGEAEVAATGIPIVHMTDDGSVGEQGLVTEPLQKLLATGALTEVWACGPEVMLAAVKKLCAMYSVPCFLSVERHMACGFGACIGCTVPKAGAPGYFKACVDGPVFPAEEVDLDGD